MSLNQINDGITDFALPQTKNGEEESIIDTVTSMRQWAREYHDRQDAMIKYSGYEHGNVYIMSMPLAESYLSPDTPSDIKRLIELITYAGYS